MRNTIYCVEFEINSLLNDEFDFKDDALEWAAEHLDDKPVVRAIDIEYPDEFGAEPIIHEEEEIFHYPVVEEVSDQEEDNLDARLAALEADEFDSHENLTEVIKVDKPNRALQYEFTDYDDEGELSEPAQKLDKAAADVSKDEAAYNTEEAEKIRQEYQNLEAACIEAEKAEHAAFMAAMDNYEHKLNDPVSLTLDQIDERDAAIAADENYKKAREATRAAFKAYKQFGADHHKEIFGIYDTMANFSDLFKDAKRAGSKRYKELRAKEFLEEGIISEIDSVAAKWNSIDSTRQEALEEDVILFDPFGCDFSDCEPMEVCKDNHRADCCDDLCQSPADFLRDIARSLGIEDEVEISEVSDEAKDPEDIVPEEVKANEEPNVEVQAEDEEPAKEIAKCHVCPECGKEICECGNKDLEEDTHPKSAQPPVSEEDAHKAAQTVANAEKKPVIYGYHGKDHHGSARFFEIDQIVCDDLKQCTKDVMTKYHPSGSVYVAYPETNEAFDDEEMSDEEFAEALKKGLEEKHAKK